MTNVKNLAEAAKVWKAALEEGDYRAQGIIKGLVNGDSYVSEAVSSSDLAKVFVAGIRQSVAAKYKKLQTNWNEIAVRKTVNDFKPQYERRFDFNADVDLADNGGVTTQPGSLPNIPEATEYPSFGFTQSASAWKLAKKGARFPFTWEMVINDEWDFISGIPDEMLKKASTTEVTEVLRQLAASGGVNSTTFSAANKNINGRSGALFAAEHPLSLDALTLAKKDVRARADQDGSLVDVPSFRLVVGTALRDQAQAILDTKAIKAVSSTRQIDYTIGNSDVSLTVSPELSRIGFPATGWFLLPDGGSDGKGDVLQLGFLKQQQTPDVRISSDGGQYLGGGDVPGLEGSLRDDKIEFRVRHSVGSNVRNPLPLLASLGTGAAAPSQYTA